MFLISPTCHHYPASTSNYRWINLGNIFVFQRIIKQTRRFITAGLKGIYRYSIGLFRLGSPCIVVIEPIICEITTGLALHTDSYLV